ncbi:MAG: SPASM domain-containing protein, partial [Chloroflexi bacterium]|nr:SPASM domain-containing protein [Chloroflexota bacterium]
RFPPLKVREVEHVIRRQADVQTRPYCHAAEGRAAAVTPDGDLYACASLAGSDAFHAGTIWEPDIEKLSALVPAQLYLAGCADCALRVICRGGCPSRRVTYTGNVLGRCDLECHLRREIYRRVMQHETH